MLGSRSRTAIGSLILACLISSIACLQAHAAAPLQFGSALDLADDSTGDGVPEIVVGDASVRDGHGAVYLFDGATGGLISSFGDEGGMAGSDVAYLAGPEPRVAAAAFRARRIDCFRARTAERAWSITLGGLGAEDEALTALHLDRIDDWNGDATEELLVHGRARSGAGWCAVLSGVEGSRLLEEHPVGQVPPESRAVHWVPRWSDETVGVLAVLNTALPAIDILDGKSTELVARIAIGCEAGDEVFGHRQAFANLGDVDGDGTADFALSLRCEGGVIRAFSGGDGGVLWQRRCTDVGTRLGNSIASYRRPGDDRRAAGLVVAGYEPFSECILHEPLTFVSTRWRSDHVGPYMGWDLAVQVSERDGTIFVAASVFSPFAESAEEVFLFVVGEPKPCLSLSGPAVELPLPR